MGIQTSDEIDLKEVFYTCARIIIVNLNLILIFFIVGSVLGLSYSLYSKKIYESKMLISSSLLTLSYTDDIVENVNAIAGSDDNGALAKKMGISSEFISKIVSVKVESAIEENLSLKESDKAFLRITLKTIDPEAFPTLQKGIVNMLENNAYVKIRVEQRRDLLKQLIVKVSKEIQDLENLKERILKGNLLEASKPGVSFDPTIVNTKIIELTKEKINYEQSLVLSNSVQIIEGFTVHTKPQWPRKPAAVLIGAALGLLIAGIVIVFKIIGAELKKQEAIRSKSVENA